MKKLIKRKNILKEAGVLLVATLIVLSTAAVTANTMNLNKKEENEISTGEAVDSKNTLSSSVRGNSGLAPISIKNPYNIKTDSSNSGSNSMPLLTSVTCYAFDVLSYRRSVWFNSGTPGTLNTIASSTSPEFISGGTWACGTTWNGWYGCEYGSSPSYTSNIWEITTTGVMTLLGSAGVPLNGLAYEDSTDTMYGASSYDLYTITPGGGSSLVGSFGTGGLMIGIAFDNTGILYGVDIVTDSLYYIDRGGATPGQAHPIGPLTDFTSGNPIDLNYAQDIEYDKINNELYLAAYLINGPPYGPHLYTCDISSGICTLIGAFPSGTEITGFAIPYCAPPPPCCLEIVDIRLVSTGPLCNRIEVEFKNTCPYPLSGDVDLTMTFTVDSTRPCPCGGPGYLNPPLSPTTPGVYQRQWTGMTLTAAGTPTSIRTRSVQVRGWAYFDLVVTLTSPSAFCTVTETKTGFTGNLLS